MFQHSQDFLFFSDVDIHMKPFSVNKKHVVSVRDVDGTQTEIKTTLGDVFLTKTFTAAHVIIQFGKLELKDETG